MGVKLASRMRQVLGEDGIQNIDVGKRICPLPTLFSRRDVRCGLFHLAEFLVYLERIADLLISSYSHTRGQGHLQATFTEKILPC